MADDKEQSGPSGPRVSAILVAYNQASALHGAIQALEQSKEREWLEILVVDCGSSDGSSQVDKDFPKVNMLRLPHHLGAARAMNIATRTAKADLLFFVSPNVEVKAETVSLLASRLDGDSDSAAACPLLSDAEGKSLARVYRIPSREELAEATKGGDLPPIAIDASQDSVIVEYPSMDALMVRKGFVRGMNFFDERFGHYWADADLAVQARNAGKKIRLYPGIRVLYHPAPDPLEGETLAQVDKISGAAALLGKHSGGGFMFRLRGAFGALGRMGFGGFTKVLGGQKLDGSQAG